MLRRRAERGEDGNRGESILVVGLGNPGGEHAGTRHNLGFEVAQELSRRWGLPRARRRFGGLIAEGRAGPAGPRVAVLLPQTYMNESGGSAGPARGALKLAPERVVVVHDEIDLPFGQVQARLGGGLAGHNGLKSLVRGFGSPEFWRIRVGVGRPSSTEPEVVSSYVLSRFREPREEVAALIERAAGEAEQLVGELGSGS
ncbi:MAG TPA: aminoacyl-tRNA hydrolase [Solirubrobacterales bacterium]|nr:aminoacyl-tRNA hydrolase [Solirubrobacterales bacterium]